MADDPVVPETNVSWWIINDDTFRTTNTEKYMNNSFFNLHYKNATNDTAFSISVDTANRNLSNDSFKIYGILYGGSKVAGYFNSPEGSFEIGPGDSGILYSIRVDGKVKFVLPPTIYRKLISSPGGGYTHSSDTTMIQGIFYEP